MRPSLLLLLPLLVTAAAGDILEDVFDEDDGNATEVTTEARDIQGEVLSEDEENATSTENIIEKEDRVNATAIGTKSGDILEDVFDEDDGNTTEGRDILDEVLSEDEVNATSTESVLKKDKVNVTATVTKSGDILEEILKEDEAKNKCDSAEMECIDMDLCPTIDIRNAFGGEEGLCPDKNQVCCVKLNTSLPATTPTFPTCQSWQACVPNHLCDSDLTIKTDGAGNIILKSGSADLPNVRCDQEGHLCCNLPKSTDQLLKEVQEQLDKESSTPAPSSGYVPSCGRRNLGGLPGVKPSLLASVQSLSSFGELPFACLVLRHVDDTGANVLACGATLIAPSVLLTSAHCIVNNAKKRLVVRCGDWDLKEALEPLSHQDRAVKSHVLHPSFDDDSLANDVAVVFTDSPFELAPHVDTVCLPDHNEGVREEDFHPEANCIAAGWGKDQFGEAGYYQTQIQIVRLPLVNSSDCESRLRETRLGQNYSLDASALCAGGEDLSAVERAAATNVGDPVLVDDVCTGDGGGPLVCARNDSKGEIRYVQMGITSWGIGCGTPGVPGVYTDVIKAMCFVRYAVRCVFVGTFDAFFDSQDDSCGDFFDAQLRALEDRADGLRHEAIMQTVAGNYSEAEDVDAKLALVEARKKEFDTFEANCLTELDIFGGNTKFRISMH